jgi:hypothetical protein
VQQLVGDPCRGVNLFVAGRSVLGGTVFERQLLVEATGGHASSTAQAAGVTWHVRVKAVPQPYAGVMVQAW